MKYCSNCGKPMDDKDAFCGNCGKKSVIIGGSDAGAVPPPFQPQWQGWQQPYQGQQPGGTNKSSSIIGSINDYIGNDKPVKLNWKVLFTDVFKRHTTAEAEEIFVCGTVRTTPPLSAVTSTWPHPWLYSRVFLAFVVSCIILVFSFNLWENWNLIPGIIAVGSFAVPLTTMVLFLEVNAYRDISLFKLIVVFLVGGCASLLATMLFYTIFPSSVDFAGAVIIGIVEELGKLVIVYIALLKMPRCSHILGGLLVGSAVGAGFAAFESAGYAFNWLLWSQGDVDVMIDLILLRGFLAPGGHVTWAAITGAALMIAKGNGPLTFDAVVSTRFLKLFAIPVVLHSVWDMPIPFGAEIYLMPILLTIAVWVVVMILINMGLDQVKQNKAIA